MLGRSACPPFHPKWQRGDRGPSASPCPAPVSPVAANARGPARGRRWRGAHGGGSLGRPSSGSVPHRPLGQRLLFGPPYCSQNVPVGLLPARTPGRGSRLLGQLLPEQPVSTPGTSSKNSVQTLFHCSIFLGSGCRIPLMGGHGTTAPLSHVANTGKGHSGTEPVTDRGRCGAQG